MNIFDTDTDPVRTGVPGLDALIADRFEKTHCMLIAARLPSHAETLSARIALNAARDGAIVYAAGLDRAIARCLEDGEAAPETLRIEPGRLYGADSVAQAVSCPRGGKSYDLAVFGILEQFTELGYNKREEELEDIGLEAQRAGDRAGCATILTAILAHEPRYGYGPLDGLEDYDPLAGHADLGLFIKRPFRPQSDDDLLFEVVKWRFGPSGVTVSATWLPQRFDFHCPVRQV